jgi:hypothetical protein
MISVGCKKRKNDPYGGRDISHKLHRGGGVKGSIKKR